MQILRTATLAIRRTRLRPIRSGFQNKAGILIRGRTMNGAPLRPKKIVPQFSVYAQFGGIL